MRGGGSQPLVQKEERTSARTQPEEKQAIAIRSSHRWFPYPLVVLEQ